LEDESKNLSKSVGTLFVIIGVIGLAISLVFQYGYGEMYGIVLTALGIIILDTVKDAKAKNAD